MAVIESDRRQNPHSSCAKNNIPMFIYCLSIDHKATAQNRDKHWCGLSQMEIVDEE